MPDELWITLSAASKMTGSPSLSMLYRLAKKDPMPSFVRYNNKNKPEINAKDPEWIDYIGLSPRESTRRERSTTTINKLKTHVKKPPGKSPTANTKKQQENDAPQPPPNDPADELRSKALEADYRKIIADAETAEYKAKSAKIQFQESIKKTTHTDFAAFAFYGYWKRINTELCGMRRRLETKIKNLVQAGDWKGVLDLIDADHEEIMREVKAAHIKDIEEYEIEYSDD